MNVKAIALRVVLGFVLAVTAACPAPKCSSANCDGCCDSKGACVKKPNNANNTTCGGAGLACTDCSKDSRVCNAVTSACEATTVVVDAGACDGCRLGGPEGSCVTLDQTSTASCGRGGATCAACSTGQLCTEGACASVDAGPPTGRIGDPCASDRECTNVPKLNGGKAYCKKRMLLGSVTYTAGYCTRYCAGQADCGGAANAHCSYWLGDTGEIEPLCYRDCSSTDCRQGYRCVDLGSASNPLPSCLPVQSDGGLGTYDAGPSNPGNAGSACTEDSQCGDAQWFQCLPERTDAGPTGFTGGLCSGDCSMSLLDSFCGDGGTCTPYLSGQNPLGYGDLVLWQCSQQCDPSAANTCRPGYVCDPFGSATDFGTCQPDCRVTEDAGVPFCNNTCNLATGLCNP